ncbi:MAG: Clp protease N-terminal domain-containing protein [Myxococcota bacterium]
MRVDPRSIVRRLNPTCTKALEAMVERAAAGRYYEIVVEHLLHGLIETEDGDVAHILQFFRKDATKVAAAVERALQGMRTGNQGKPTFSASLFQWLEDAWVVASLERGSVQLRSGDLLLQFLTQPGRYTGESIDELDGLELDELRKNFDQIIAGSKEALEVPTTSDAGVAAPGKA